MINKHHEWQAVLFDFDGVIAASHEVKSPPLPALFAAHGPEVQRRWSATTRTTAACPAT